MKNFVLSHNSFNFQFFSLLIYRFSNAVHKKEFGIDIDGILYIWVDIITCGHLDHVIVARKHLELEQLSVDVNVLLL